LNHGAAVPPSCRAKISRQEDLDPKLALHQVARRQSVRPPSGTPKIADPPLAHLRIAGPPVADPKIEDRMIGARMIEDQTTANLPNSDRSAGGQRGGPAAMALPKTDLARLSARAPRRLQATPNPLHYPV